MRTLSRPWRAAIVALAFVLPPIGCKMFEQSMTPSPAPTQRGLDDPPPLHTGGLDVLSVNGAGQQGPTGSPASHGDPLSAAIAAGVGAAVVGTTAAKTAIDCAQPDASATCLRGPGPGDNRKDGGITYP